MSDPNRDVVLPSAETLLSDPASSYWLKSALQSALQRDPVDALNDALLLADILDTNLRMVLGLDDP